MRQRKLHRADLFNDFEQLRLPVFFSFRHSAIDVTASSVSSRLGFLAFVKAKKAAGKLLFAARVVDVVLCRSLRQPSGISGERR